ncbi:MAG: ABC transporter substrate-binding protein SapA [Sodalis sp. (in: enterobacteria)]
MSIKSDCSLTRRTVTLLIALIITVGTAREAANTAPDATSPPPRSNAEHALLLPICQSGFVYCISGAVNTFNPQMASSGIIVDTLSAQLYDRLLAVEPYTYRLISELAQRWEVLDNGATYRFYLRTNMVFQHTAWFTPTRMLNADDIVFSFARMFDIHHLWHAVNGGNYPYFDSLQFPQAARSVKRIDNDTIEFRLERPNASFLWHLANYYAPVLSAEYADRLTVIGHQKQLDRLPVGTGPFMLNEYHSGQFIRLTHHENYWRGMPRMSQVVIDLSAGRIGRLSPLLSGECDVLAYPSASQLSILRDDPRLRLTLGPGMNIAYLAFNTRKPPLNDIRLRRAIALAINNTRLIQFIYYGVAESAAALLPRASLAYDNKSRITEYNPAKARALLRKLGKLSLRLNLLVPTASQSYNPSPLKTAELIQADLAQVGIRLTIIPIERHFQQAPLTEVTDDITLSGWSSNSNDLDSIFRLPLSCAAINSQTNHARWCNSAFDALLHRALFSQQLASRTEIYHDAQKMLVQQLPVLPLVSSLSLQAYRFGIRGLVLSSSGNTSFASVYRDELKEKTPL